MTSWGGTKVSIADLPEGESLKKDFLKSFVKMKPKKYKKYWVAQAIKGKGVAPPEHSPKDMVAFVEGTKGAMGYVDKSVIGSAKVKVLTVK